MIFLLLSILASTALFVIFKLFDLYNINTLQAIVVNYAFAALTGILTFKGETSITAITSANWFLGAVMLGLLFISVFNVMALTSQRNGISVASVAGKMSVIIPILFGIFIYKEMVNTPKIIGILLALIAVYLTSVKSKSNINLKQGLLLPLLLFLGSGIIDTAIKYMETTYLKQGDLELFLATIFSVACIIGLGFIILKIIKGAFTFKLKNVIGGIVLGFINYLSMYFLIIALQYKGLESSSLFTINNVAIVALSTVLGLAFFKEKLDTKNWIGIALALVSIVLVSATS